MVASKSLLTLLLTSLITANDAFTISTTPRTTSMLQMVSSHNDEMASRRNFFQSTATSLLTVGTILTNPTKAFADEAPAPVRSVQTNLYSILRVREATEQETRLIKSGKFKDVQRANVKLAVKFMLANYNLSDNFIAASAYLPGTKRVQAGDVGQNTVQNLFTILEYFDSSDVQNIKVSNSGLGGKENLVLSGLDATRKGIDEFLSYFPKEDVEAVVAKINEENEMNFKEFDPELGAILNPKPL
jgi:hypothetical protein